MSTSQGAVAAVFSCRGNRRLGHVSKIRQYIHITGAGPNGLRYKDEHPTHSIVSSVPPTNFVIQTTVSKHC